MIINHNMSAIFSNNRLRFTNDALTDDMSKLSSGLRINKAGDDASGLAVSEKMRTQIRGLKQASDNASNGISLIQTAEGYLQESEDIIQRVRELAIQSSNGIYTPEDRMQIQVEVSQLIDEVDRIASHAEFNTMKLLKGDFANPANGGTPAASMWLHIGANMDQRKQVFIGTMTAEGLKLRDNAKKIVSLSTPGGANSSIATLDGALLKINKQRADLGAYQNRISYAIKGIEIGAENIQAAESRIRDMDMAKGMVEYTKNNILAQAGTSMLAQANVRTQAVLGLLR